MSRNKKYSPKRTLAFGYKRDTSNDHIEIYEKQALLVRRAFEHFTGQREYGNCGFFEDSNVKVNHQ